MGNKQVAVFRNQCSVFRGFVAPSLLMGFLIFFALFIFCSCLKAASNDSSQNRTQDYPAAQPIPKGSFFDKHAEGWHWYQNQEIEIRNQDSERKSQEKHSPTQTIEEQREKLEQKLHAAIIEPSRENIVSYILAQKMVMDQSQRFSESWKRVVMTTPSLDETLVHPVDQNARHVYYDEQNKDLQTRIKGLAKEYGLFFFFREKCPYCHAFAPIVKRFSQKYGWSVLPISLDGGVLPEFPDAKRDNGISGRLQIAHVPALIALHPTTGKLIPLAYGMVSESEIERRIEILTQLSEISSQGVQK